MFDFSIGEIFIILLAILIFVPIKDLPNFAYKFGKNYKKIKLFLLKIKNQWHDVYQELEDTIEGNEKGKIKDDEIPNKITGKTQRKRLKKVPSKKKSKAIKKNKDE